MNFGMSLTPVKKNIQCDEVFKICEDDFKKQFCGLGYLIKDRFLRAPKDYKIKLELPDNIEEILLGLIKNNKNNNNNNNNNKFIHYFNVFTMSDGHICKNPIIKLKNRNIKSSWFVTRIDWNPIDKNIAFIEPERLKIVEDTQSVTLDAVCFEFIVEVTLDCFNNENDDITRIVKTYNISVTDPIDYACIDRNKFVHENCEIILPDILKTHTDKLTKMRDYYDGYELIKTTTLKITDKSENCIIVKSEKLNYDGNTYYRIWLNENNDIYGIQMIGRAHNVECDDMMTVNEFFEKYPDLKSDWENVI